MFKGWDCAGVQYRTVEFIVVEVRLRWWRGDDDGGGGGDGCGG